MLDCVLKQILLNFVGLFSVLLVVKVLGEFIELGFLKDFQRLFMMKKSFGI